jgi:branched-chain amino acid aminotransferase
MQYHVDGELVPAKAATVSVRDRGFRYGDAAFETLRAYGGAVFEWATHEERLRRTAERLGFAEAVPADLAVRVAETLDANGVQDAYVRLSVSRGTQLGRLTPDLGRDVDPTVVVVVEPLPRGGLAGEPVWSGPATLQIVKPRAVPDAAIPSGLKTHNYLNGILARLELERAATEAYRADEALIRDGEGFVAEGATSNVFFVDGGTLKTPSADGPLLPGVTRSVVLDLAATEGFTTETGRYAPTDVRGADEVFLTNTTWEIRPVDRVDGVAVGAGGGGDSGGGRKDAEPDVGSETGTHAGPMTRLLSRLFDELVERRHYGRDSHAGGRREP